MARACVDAGYVLSFAGVVTFTNAPGVREAAAVVNADQILVETDAPFLAPEVFRDRNATLDRWCEREQRDPRAITRTVNLGLAVGRDAAAVRHQEENLRLMFGPMADLVRPGILVGTPAQVVDRIGAYVDAGAEWVILALRAPFDWDGLELFVRDVMPAFGR